MAMSRVRGSRLLPADDVDASMDPCHLPSNIFSCADDFLDYGFEMRIEAAQRHELVVCFASERRAGSIVMSRKSAAYPVV
jgi:hypothetical protein